VLAAAAKSSNPDVLRPLVHGLAALWPLWLLVALVGAGKLAWRLYELRRLSRSGIAEVDRMDGTTFEVFLTTLFRRLGYSVEHTGRRGDYGADLVVPKDGLRIAVQAKRWTKTVGIKAVQEAVASKGIYKCAEALVVANRPFTRQARTLADANDVQLWDRDVLVAKLLAVGNGATDAPTVATNAVPTRPATAEPTLPRGEVAAEDDVANCATCGVTVSEKVRDYCLARPKRFGGRIYCYQHQRRPRVAGAEPRRL
jgi:restriction system protein